MVILTGSISRHPALCDKLLLLSHIIILTDYHFCLFIRIPAWLAVKIGHLLGASFELRGLENINRDIGGVVLINHQSAIDLIGRENFVFELNFSLTLEGERATEYLMKTIFFHVLVLAKLWPVIGRATQVAKKEVFFWFPFGLACWLWGTLFINRENNSAQAAINKQSRAITERKASHFIDFNVDWNLLIFSDSISVENFILPRGNSKPIRSV